MQAGLNGRSKHIKIARFNNEDECDEAQTLLKTGKLE